MPEVKKNISKKWAIAFIGIMLFFTFTSRTIHYFMTPKVTASRVESGYIRYNIPIREMDFYTENEIEIKIPEKLEKPFVIGDIPVEEGDVVNKGDTLVLFEKSSYSNILSERKKEVERLKIELIEFDKNYFTKINQIEKEIQDLTYQMEEYKEVIANSCENTEELLSIMEEIKKLELQYNQKAEELGKNKKLYEADVITYQDIERAENDLKSLEEQINSKYAKYDRQQKKLMEDYQRRIKEGEYKVSQLSEELRYIKSTGILNGKSRTLINAELKEAKQKLEFIAKYPELKSSFDGIVGKIFYKTLDSYDGVRTIISIKPAEEFKSFIISIADNYKAQDYNDILKEDVPCVLKYGTYNINGTIAGNITKNGANYFIISINKSGELKVEEIKLPEKNDSITMEVKGNYCNILVPNSAFISENELFVLKTRKGFWGEEYYAVKQKVKIGEGNEYFTQVTDGLLRSDMVITGWDRALNDGATVTLPLE